MRFSEYEKQYIINNYKTMKTKDIAKNLNMDYIRIKNFANNNHLKKGCTHVFFNDEQEKYIEENYNIEKTKEIAKKLNTTIRDVNIYGAYKNLIFNSDRYTLNENFFEKIDTHEKAYWLGFLYADGCISIRNRNDKKSYILEVTLTKEDETHLEKLKMCLKSNTPIKYKTIKNKYNACRINICNKKICEDLIKLGCTPKKSLTLKFPSNEQVPKELIPHFIRGYLDGDGCVHKGDKKISISFVGTKEFLDKLQYIVYEELGLTKTIIQNKGKAYQCSWGGLGNLKTWYDYLYDYENIIFLQRKFEKFFA